MNWGLFTQKPYKGFEWGVSTSAYVFSNTDKDTFISTNYMYLAKLPGLCAFDFCLYFHQDIYF